MPISKSTIQLYTKRAITDNDIALWVDVAIKELSALYDTAKVSTQSTLNAVSGDFYPLPSGCLRITKVEQYEADSWSFYKEYYINSGEIRFDDTGEFRITYLIKPLSVDSIDVSYMPSIEKYIASRDLSECNPTKSKELMEEFFRDVSIVNADLKNSKRNIGGRIPTPPFR